MEVIGIANTRGKYFIHIGIYCKKEAICEFKIHIVWVVKNEW
jgi:hypothetical protein